MRTNLNKLYNMFNKINSHHFSILVEFFRFNEILELRKMNKRVRILISFQRCLTELFNLFKNFNYMSLDSFLNFTKNIFPKVLMEKFNLNSSHQEELFENYLFPFNHIIHSLITITRNTTEIDAILISKALNSQIIRIKKSLFINGILKKNITDILFNESFQQKMIKSIKISSAQSRNTPIQISKYLNNPYLKKLTLKSIFNGDEDAENFSSIISNSPNLELLNLSIPITKDKFEIIAKSIYNHQTLNTLIIDDCKLQLDSVECLSNIISLSNSLRRLYIIHCLIGDADIKVLSKGIRLNQSLNLIDFSYNFIKDEGLSFLCDQLIDYSTISSIKLMNNRFHNEGIINLSKFVQKSKSLTSLDIQGNLISANSLKTFLRSIELSTLKKVYLSSNDIYPTDELTILSSSNLETLGVFSSSPNFYYYQLMKRIVTESSSIKEVILNSNASNNFGDFIQSCINILILDLSSSLFKDEQVQDLSKILSFNKIQELKLNSCSLTSFQANFVFNALENNSSLINLELTRNSFGNEGAICLAKNIQYHPNLKRIILASTNITNKGCISIAQMLERNMSLTHLDLTMNSLPESALSAFSFALTKNNHLLHFIMSSCGINSEGMKHLCEGLITNNTLQIINLSNNSICEKSITYISELLLKNKCLKKIILCQNFLENRMGLLKALMKSKIKVKF
jgi:Ran GTPase-activating protein (RanGAP) involved in mRNA processing and transport